MSGRATGNEGVNGKDRRVSHFMKAPAAVELLRAQHGCANARKVPNAPYALAIAVTEKAGAAAPASAVRAVRRVVARRSCAPPSRCRRGRSCRAAKGANAELINLATESGFSVEHASASKLLCRAGA
jgi:hypothetical protein